MGRSQVDLIPALLQLPSILDRGSVLLTKKFVALGDDVVVKFGQTIEPTELHLMQYITTHCPATKCPKPLGFVILDKTRYLFMSRVKGTTLHSVWPSLTVEEKETVSSSLEEMLSAMRNLPWPLGHPLGTVSPPYICQDTYTRTGGPIYNEAAFNNFLLRDPLPRLSTSYMT